MKLGIKSKSVQENGERKNIESEQHIIVLEDVTKTYEMGKVEVHALRGADLIVQRGDFMVILGPSGSGKTTLLNLIGGIDTPMSGKVIMESVDLSNLKEKDLTQFRRTKIGFVFQFFNLIPTLTAEENVELAAELVENPRNVERSRELATMRTIGITMRRIAGMVTLENALLGFVGIFLGLPAGNYLAKYFFTLFTSDLFVLDTVTYSATYVSGAATIFTVLLVSSIPGLRYVRNLNLAKVVKEQAR